MTSTEQRYYKVLRGYWKETAINALAMARNKVKCEQLGVTFEWQDEDESPRCFFGEPSRYECDNCGAVFYTKGDCPKCDNPKVRFVDTGVYYDPTAEHLCCIARGRDEAVLDSLGMIDRAWDKGRSYEGYWFYVECQMAGEALGQLDSDIMSEKYEGEETEQTLG